MVFNSLFRRDLYQLVRPFLHDNDVRPTEDMQCRRGVGGGEQRCADRAGRAIPCHRHTEFAKGQTIGSGKITN